MDWRQIKQLNSHILLAPQGSKNKDLQHRSLFFTRNSFMVGSIPMSITELVNKEKTSEVVFYMKIQH